MANTVYEKKKCLYSGPFCDIYSATDGNNKPVALKVVDVDFLKKPHDFRQEIRLLRRLKHPGVVEFLDEYKSGEDFVLVMPLYAGDLVSVMESHKRKRVRFNLADPTANTITEKNELPLGDCRKIVALLLDSIKYVHSQGIIHRDIKPANIMFSLLEDLSAPVLGDFGIAYDTTTVSVSEPSHEKISDIGLGYYRAPELCFGVSDYGYEVDLWAMGIVISYLYSSDGKPANYYKEPEMGHGAELNDLALIQGTFNAFGTPDAFNSESPYFWPRLADPDCHFTAFNYSKQERKPIDKLLPRCDDAEVARVFEWLTKYHGRELHLLSKK